MGTEPIDLEDLQALAELSRVSWEPQPQWSHHSGKNWYTRDDLRELGHDVADADYLVALRPHAVLALIAELRDATEAIARAHALADRWEHGALRWEDPLPVPPAVGQLRDALKGGQ
ncbi:hypothetical protein HYG77_04900 [Rhodococcus sp. ZPP]|uniref:hypothetical protein n=1 Tax=Rhodococcus sp. ZPP TaxID=2749906 RepID=UPI001AD851F5|nr:hypothetical protein [Rhodococcus sp. ZPP]QTJ65002.1 hypothetical protein HYG77_04900 [Rhodococcus sp. ZPP]